MSSAAADKTAATAMMASDPSTTRPSISLLIDQQTATHGPHAGTVCETLAGRPIPPQTMSRLACDALVTPIVINGAGQPLKVGRTRRTATDAQRKALRTLYSTCPIDGVTPLDRCEYHHVIYYENGGNTDLDNLIPYRATGTTESMKAAGNSPSHQTGPSTSTTPKDNYTKQSHHQPPSPDTNERPSPTRAADEETWPTSRDL